VSFEPSPARRGLDALLKLYPFHDLIAVDWQIDESEGVQTFVGPWVLVDLGQPSETVRLGLSGDVAAWATWRFAIWRSTGAVHVLGHDGAVSDDPIIEPPGDV
jgi:hypothetical protein